MYAIGPCPYSLRKGHKDRAPIGLSELTQNASDQRKKPAFQLAFCFVFCILYFAPRKDKPPADFSTGGVRYKSLTMTYFHTGIRTIIGAGLFHCPVRDGKEWGQTAIVIRQNCCVRLELFYFTALKSNEFIESNQILIALLNVFATTYLLGR